MHSILFIGEAVCLAHVIRPMSLALGLRRQRPGHEIHFACGDAYRYLPESNGLTVHSLPTIKTRDFYNRMYAGKPGYDQATLDAYVVAESRLIRELEPDLVVGDMRLTLAVSCRLAGIPYVNMVNAHWSPHYTLGFPVPDLPATRLFGDRISRIIMPLVLPVSFRQQAEPYNRISREHGLPSIGSLKDVFTAGDHVLYLDTPGLSPTQNLPTHHHYLGAILWEPDIPMPAAVPKPRSDQKQVYVTMGSSGDTGVVADTVAVCRSAGYRVVVTADQPTTSWQDDSEVIAAPMMPGVQVMKHCDLMICHGGSGTVYQALAQGVPVLGICANADQQLVMQGVENAGAGIGMRVRDADTQKIQQAVSVLINGLEYRHSAVNAAREIRTFGTADRFIAVTERILGPVTEKHKTPKNRTVIAPNRKTMELVIN